MRPKAKYPKVHLNVRIKECTLKEIDIIANEKKLERSELVRLIIENYVNMKMNSL